MRENGKNDKKEKENQAVKVNKEENEGIVLRKKNKLRSLLIYVPQKWSKTPLAFVTEEEMYPSDLSSGVFRFNNEERPKKRHISAFESENYKKYKGKEWKRMDIKDEKPNSVIAFKTQKDEYNYFWGVECDAAHNFKHYFPEKNPSILGKKSDTLQILQNLK